MIRSCTVLHCAKQLLAVAGGTGVFFAGYKEAVDELGVGCVAVVCAEHDDIAAVWVDVGGFAQCIGEVVEAAAVQEEEKVVFGLGGGRWGEGDDED